VDRFVQNSIFKHLCADWTANDKYFVFLTQQAEPDNWKGDKYDDKMGLSKTLAKNGFAVTPTPVREMPEGYSEEQIWQVFQRVFDCLEPGDQVWLDITHGFRSLPLLATVLIDYARFLKNVTIEKIYYGVFESLGTLKQIQQEYPNPADRLVPVLNLTAFSQLQDWTSAANEFINFGHTGRLAQLANNNRFDGLGDVVQEVSGAISAVRGLTITEGKVFVQAKESLAEASGTLYPPPLGPLLDKVSQRLQNYQHDNAVNGFVAVDWCIDHQLIQQGITLLYEFMITYAMTRVGENYRDENLRMVASGALMCDKKEKFDYTKFGKVEPNVQKRLVEQVFALPFKNKFTKNVYQKFSEGTRHDIDHAGYRSKSVPKSSAALATSLIKYRNLANTILGLGFGPK
jgi:CRISPR-associated Csx2 family protein